MVTADRPIRQRVPGDRTLLVDALVGAAVTVVLAIVPLAPAIGGVVAGYLHREEGARVGALAGLFAAVPLGLLVGLLMVAFGFFVPLGPAPGPVRALLGVLAASMQVGYGVVAGCVVGGTAGGVLGVRYAERREGRTGDQGRPAPASGSTSR
jgi:hypothetical protein